MLSTLFQKKGVVICLLISLVFLFCDWSKFSQPTFWKILLFCSCVLTFFTAYLATHNIYQIWQAICKKQKKKRNQFSWIKNTFSKKSQEYQAYILSLRETVEKLKEENCEQAKFIAERNKQIENMQVEVEFVLKQKHQLIADNFETRKELGLEKLQIDELRLQKKLPLQTTTVLPDEYKKLEEKFRNERSLHHQLRSQFAEKTELLAQTRKELFHLETEVLGNQRPGVEVTAIERNLSYSLQKAYSELEQLQEENLLLEQLVNTFLST